MSAGEAFSATSPVRLVGVAAASPPRTMTQDEAARAIQERYAAEVRPRTLAAMRKVFSHPSVRTRRFAFSDAAEVFNETPDERMGRFARWAVRLARDASQAALASARIESSALAAVVVNTCTGYLCPGISTYLMEELALPPGARVYDLVGSGCGGAVPNLQLGQALCLSRRGPVLCVSTEVCSATFQMGDDLGLIISNALFGDGAGACVLANGSSSGLAFVDSESITLPAYREDVRYVYSGGQLRNQLSLGLPEVLADQAPRVVNSLLLRRGLTVADVRHWAVHPGGQKVIDALARSLGLDERQLAVTREILRDRGNVSSATVWFELERILEAGVSPGDYCVMLAAGAGLSIHAALLQA